MRNSPMSEMRYYVYVWQLTEFDNHLEIEEQRFAEWMGWC